MNNPRWEAVIGLEVHVQLATQSKIFSGASNAAATEPNTHVCPVDLALPGALPVLNEAAVRMAVMFGLAIGAKVNRQCIFDRKNYFYPDLPKGYQISQFSDPIVGAGHLDITLEDGTVRRIGVTRAHLEEDAGKSVHGLLDGHTGVDLNRTGTPLLEVVSEPDLRTPAEAAAYFRTMHSLVTHLGICEGNLNEGNMRCDANVSIRPAGATHLGERTELKNINSFRFVELAVTHEIERQIAVLERGETIHRETRLYDADRDETRAMRGKEFSDDYRYFPDPDLLPVTLDEAFIAAVAAELPELPAARRERYEQQLGLSAYDAQWLTQDPAVATFFEAALAVAEDAKQTANWVMGDLSGKLNKDERSFADCPLSPEQLGTLILRIKDETISGKIAKQVFELAWASDDPVDTIIEREGLKQVSDTGELQAIIEQLVADNPTQAEQYRGGKEKLLGFFVGQVMKATQGKANPAQVNELLKKALT